MNSLWRTTRQLPTRRSWNQHRSIADLRPFVEGDNIVLRHNKDQSAPPVLLKLQPGKRRDTHKGSLTHDDIIGQRPRALVPAKTKSGAKTDYRIHEARLDEYVRLTRRLVTPLYPQDAALIVSLLDLHPSPPGRPRTEHEPALEILEAGTGHGALTLYLSRAVHAANSIRPPAPRDDDDPAPAEDAWRAGRHAVIHSIDISPRYSAHARDVVRGFRHGMYAHNVDFHVGDVSAWVSSTLTTKRQGKPFLSHVILDLPGSEEHLAAVARALRTDGTLVVFNPSITQIMDCLAKVKQDGVPLVLEQVIELGVNGGTGGREWDVRAVKPRASMKSLVENASDSAGGEEDDSGNVSESDRESDVSAPEEAEADVGWKMICRPKVGELIVGGGFLGVFRKWRDVQAEA